MNSRQHSALREQEFSDIDAAQQQRLLAELARVVPATALLATTEELRPYECDGLSAYRRLPLAVVLAATEDEVMAVLKICHALGVPVVARGAGTGLSGGALPHENGVVLSLAKMKNILHLDPVARHAVVEPGVRNLAVTEAAAPFGLYYAPDPSSQIACSIGGNVAENSGGVHCLKYGLTVHNVLRVRGLTMAGEVVEFGNHALDAPGYDLLALMTGSEGLLAVITAVTVKLIPKPELAQVIMASFDSVEKAGGRGGYHRRRHHSGRTGDDGQGGHRRRRTLRQGGLRHECRSHTAVRVRWYRRRSGRRGRGHARSAGK
jgi:glycolate oxidase